MKIEFLNQIFFKDLGENQTVLFYSKFPEILGTLGKSLKNKTNIEEKWGILRKNGVLQHFKQKY